MFKKLLAFTLCLILIFAVCGCKENEIVISDDTESTVEQETFYNELTGLPIEESKKDAKPIAVMVNNISLAQGVQTGLNSVDVIYETIVEGGITRMVTVTKDASKLPQLGTVRSARYVFLDLALGHNATYVHAGYDHTYFAPHKNALGVKTMDINSSASKYGFREKNGLASEHTLYTTGAKLEEGRKAMGIDTTYTPQKWLTFADTAAPITPATPCTKLNVFFSGTQKTGFNYDAATGKYIKSSNGKERTDYKTGEKLAVKNVFVLFTSVSAYADKYHMNIGLEGGNGYYISNGGAEDVKWSKGGAKDPLKITKADGSELTVNAGNTYICITGKNDMAKTTISAE